MITLCARTGAVPHVPAPSLGKPTTILSLTSRGAAVTLQCDLNSGLSFLASQYGQRSVVPLMGYQCIGRLRTGGGVVTNAIVNRLR